MHFSRIIKEFRKIIAQEKSITFSVHVQRRRWEGLHYESESDLSSILGAKKPKNIEAVKSASMTHSHMTHEHHTHNCVGDKTTVNISLFVLSFGCDMKVD